MNHSVEKISAAAMPSPSSAKRRRVRRKRKRGGTPSSLSDDPHAEQHALDAARRRAKNSPPKSPLRRVRPHDCPSPLPIASRLQFDRPVDDDLDLDDERKPQHNEKFNGLPPSTSEARVATNSGMAGGVSRAAAAVARVGRQVLFSMFASSSDDSDSDEGNESDGGSDSDDSETLSGSFHAPSPSLPSSGSYVLETPTKKPDHSDHAPSERTATSTSTSPSTSTADEDPDPESSPGGGHNPDYEEIPAHRRKLIERVCERDWGVESPREFQVQAIHRGAYYDDTFLTLCAKTGYGKSLVALAIMSLKRGVGLIEVPLIGLGTDQVSKAMRVEKNIEAWHVDEFRGNDAELLRKRLTSATQEQLKDMSIILFLSPRALLPDSDWMPPLRHLALQGHISLICVDEAHCANLYGDGFRPELVESLKSTKMLLKIPGEAMACTGGAGLPEKSFMLAAFRGDPDLFTRPQREELADATIDDEMCEPANVRVMAATAAANCGISSNLCHRSYRVGPPPNLYDLVQEMGRTDRDRKLPPGWNRYEIHLSWQTVLTVYVRIMRQKSGPDRERQIVHFFQLLQIICTPRQCFHVSLESYFEYDTSGSNKTPCGKYCSFCTGGHDLFAGTFRKQELIGVLFNTCFHGTQRQAEKFVNEIKKARDTVYKPGEVPNNVVGPIHGLCIQLLANGIIEFGLSDDGKAHSGKDSLEMKHVIVKPGVVISSSGVPEPAFLRDDKWAGMKFTRDDHAQGEGAEQRKCGAISRGRQRGVRGTGRSNSRRRGGGRGRNGVRGRGVRAGRGQRVDRGSGRA